MRKIVFAEEEYYHIYNRGVDKREVFSDDADYARFLINLKEFNNELIREERNMMQALGAELSSDSELSSDVDPLVEIVAYCFNPNHFHLILKQVAEKGIGRYMHKVSTGYTNYFNKKYERSGSLFQGPFKAIHIDSNDYLLYLSAYVNRNYFIHSYQKEGSEWKYCSAPDYLGKRNDKLCNKKIILDQFKNGIKEYANFLKVKALHLKQKKETEKYCLE